MSFFRFAALFACCLWFSLGAGPLTIAEAAPSAPASDPAGNAKTAVSEPTQDVWYTLLQKRVEELGSIDAETEALAQKLPEKSLQLNEALKGLEEEYQRLLTLSRVSWGLPLELSVVQQRLARLQERLSNVLAPLHGTLGSLKGRLDEISLLEQDSTPTKEEVDASPELQAFLKDLDQTQERLTPSVSGSAGRWPLPASFRKTSLRSSSGWRSPFPACGRSIISSVPAAFTTSSRGWTSAKASMRSRRPSPCA
ncbi:MAG: hypothetical protein V8Q84_00705 [Bilophila sp.]